MNARPLFLSVPLAGELLAGLARRLGAPSWEALSPDVAGMAEEALARVMEAARPRALVRTAVEIRAHAGGLEAGELCIQSPRWGKLLRKAQNPLRLAAFALTLGPDVDRILAQCAEQSLGLGYAADAAASELAEDLAGRAETAITAFPEFTGLAATRRFSPGYCDIPIRDQEAVFAFLRPEEIGLALTSSHILAPRKSVTAMVALAQGLSHATPCPRCPETACDHRRIAEGGE